MSEPTTAEPLVIEVTPEDTHVASQKTATTAILAHPALRQFFPAADLWVVGFDVADKGDAEGALYLAYVLDTDTGRAARVDGWIDDPDSPDIDPVVHQWPPTDDEFAWAVSIVAEDRNLGPLLEPDGASAYRPLPPLLNIEHPDGTVDRVIAVGIRTPAPDDGQPSPSGHPGQARHRIVGVRIGDGEVFPDAPGVPAPSTTECGPPPVPPEGRAGGERQARVRVRRGDTVLWDLVLVRPSASSGITGSGVELRTVDYRDQAVLFRAHSPVLTIDHGPEGRAAGCGPHLRSWQNEEAGFEAAGEGDDAVPGFRVCTSAPRTILDTGADGGDFRGVALWVDGDEVVITSQIRAGWDRYVSEWRLGTDGRIRPRFGIAATRNPCTCNDRRYHVYWRLDFDVLGAENVIQEFNDPPVLGTGKWHTVKHEVRRLRSGEHGRYWRVRNHRASQGYSIVPGPADGEADPYGAGDVWVLRYRAHEVDDGQGVTADPLRSRAQLDRFVNGESVERHDLVVWYAAHVELADGTIGGVGPDLVPWQWKDAPPVAVSFAHLQPPTNEELRPPSRRAT